MGTTGDFKARTAAFRAKAGRVVVLALTNRTAIATVFHLHGHHFRLLDRLDDGWKPFWLDTLAIEPGQTQRIAFLAEYAGRWLIEQSRPTGQRRGSSGGTCRVRRTNMSKPVPAIRSVKARGVVVPIARPVKTAFSTIDAAPLVLIDVETDQGVTGQAYIFAYARLTQKPLVHLIEEIGRELTGQPVAPYDLMAAMDAKFRLLGWQGLVGMAVSGLDMAYWDALGQVSGRPLAELLGGSPRPIKAYDSYGVVDPDADEKALRRSLEQGFRGIKIKGGDGDAANDERMVKGVRALLGPDVALMLDFNQSLDPTEASAASPARALRSALDRGAVPQENLSGHAKVRETSPTPIQAGENWWFPRGFAEAIAVGASDFIMPDLMKCGGVTGWLQVAGQAEAADIPMSSHLFAEASAHMLAVTPTAHWLEFLDFPASSSSIPPRSSMARSPREGQGSGWNGTKRR